MRGGEEIALHGAKVRLHECTHVDELGPVNMLTYGVMIE